MSVWRYWTSIIAGALGGVITAEMINGHPDAVWLAIMGCLIAGAVAGWAWESAYLRRESNARMRVWDAQRREVIAQQRESRT